ncbi:MAG TPA: hypothetical protein VHC69_32330 [Polyangiaceae bacterium]|nr:hypothetical protein [Polyangiaceae bacterium]
MNRMPPVPELDCVDVQEALFAGRALSAAEAEHAASCPVCSQTLPKGDLAPSAPLLAAVESAVRHETGFVAGLRALPTSTRMLSGIVAAALFAVGMASTRPRWAFGPVPVRHVALVLGVLAVLLAALLRLTLRPLQLAAPNARLVRASVATALLVPVFFALTPPGAEALPLGTPGMVGAALGCFVFGAIPGVLLVVALRALDRNAHRAVDVAVLAAACGGLAGNAALEMHCPSVAPLHLLLGHASVGVALVVVYFALASRTTRR